MDRQIKKKKWTAQRIALGIGALAFLAFSIYSIVVSGRQSTLNVNREKITVSDVTRGVFDEFIVVTGVVQPLKIYQLDAIEGGYVVQKYLDGGASVKQGDLILRLENQRLTLEYVNREKGGVHGRKIVLKAYDDGYDPAAAVKKEFSIPDEAEVVALLAIGKAKPPDKPYGGRFELSRIMYAEKYGEAWKG